MELSKGISSSNAQARNLIIKTFEKVGIEFIGTPDDKLGVYFKS